MLSSRIACPAEPYFPVRVGKKVASLSVSLSCSWVIRLGARCLWSGLGPRSRAITLGFLQPKHLQVCFQSCLGSGSICFCGHILRSLVHLL